MSEMSEASVDLTALANHLGSDKGTTTYCGHGYTRIYEAFLGPARHVPLVIAEIGLMHIYTQADRAGKLDGKDCPSLSMWAEYLSGAIVNGFDIRDFTPHPSPRIRIRPGDQGNREDLRLFASECGPFDLIIDDGSHASHHQQITLGILFPHLRPGGLYVIEDMHFQPQEIEMGGITPTRDFLRGLRHGVSGARVALEQGELSSLIGGLREVRLFDSISPKWPRQQLEDALAVLVKQGQHPAFPPIW